ncbi:hypothetical protein TrCOL_g710 [Triparma columacea]|uniref:Uncharacterized protein n=1 Tax=Triparma columacea TaxID=722753 RepID=A0A9W7GHL7_9STRA|nr:hypothetical protein TrCOL_g710 [Triparma columacea]
MSTLPSLVKPCSWLLGTSELSMSTLPSLVKPCSWLLGTSILLGYHLNLYKRESSGEQTWRKSQVSIRVAWSSHVRSTENWLYAVQTLRNAITAQTFLATTVLSLLTVVSGRMWDLVRASVDPGDRRRLVAQFVAVSGCLLLSAHNFLQGARLMTHAGFMFPVTAAPGGLVKGEAVDKVIEGSQNAQWLGLRWLYLAIAATVWIVGGEGAYCIAAVGFWRFFKELDKPPSII